MARNMQVGQLEPFDESTSDWPAYDERLLAYIQVNHIEDADKVFALVSIVGAKTYGLLKSLCSPDKPTSKTFDVVLKLLRAHFTPEPSVIGERAKFHRRTQRDNESITEFVASLRKLAETCDFGLFLDESLRDRFVCGLQRVEIQRVLFTEDKKLSFQKAVDKALALENASKNATATHAKYESPGDLFKIQAEKTRSGLSAECYGCASAKHASLWCPFINATCYQCNKKGHIRRACKSRARKRYQGGKPIPKRYDTVRTLSIPIKEIQDGKSDPIGVTMTVNGFPLTMELDTGAAVSVISAHDFKATFGYGQFQKTDLKLRTYTGEEVAPLGVVQVQVQYNNQAASLPLYVVHQPGPPLLGRQWSRCIRLDWPSLCNFCRVSVPQDTAKDVRRKLKFMLDKYGAIFKDELGTVKGVKAQLFLKDGSRPTFMKARSVPIALQPAVEQELLKLQDLGIINPVLVSEFATPIVPVIEKDGSLRICGDYKTTVNPMLDIDHYPLPKIEELLSSLAGGQKFSKIDLSRAYQQIEMCDESKKYLTLNTHKGLFEVNRLLFGIASAPGISQRIMENVLKGLPKVCVTWTTYWLRGRHRKNTWPTWMQS
ncbi:uncharacterized protein K02A2.6-like [Ornithodoros turicata]|uniref:uncharacterized protein K02A2.6-like n=1 Tax=Ornithodoros turicata TaxID=34597 RepID=UPI0031390A3C